MAITNQERVGKALELFRTGLAPYVEREFANAHKDKALAEARRMLPAEDRINGTRPIAQWDAAVLLKVMWDAWNDVFGRTLGRAERSLVQELRDARNCWAHQDSFTGDDAYRALDSVHRLLLAISSAQAEEVEKMKMELLRVRFDEQARSEKRKTASTAIESAVAGSLKPWREVVTPHKDVASGRYQQAEFAADLWQVHLGQGTDEYKNPVEFFRRTYLTESLKGMLVGAVRRLAGKGGDPVVQLQTNFGGGKTHSMLALYHLFSGVAPTDLAGIDAVMKEAEATKLTSARRVVLVGNKISPGNPSTKADGTVVRTLWGELAWQLGGKKAFARIKADDEKATSPGDVLREPQGCPSICRCMNSIGGITRRVVPSRCAAAPGTGASDGDARRAVAAGVHDGGRLPSRRSASATGVNACLDPTGPEFSQDRPLETSWFGAEPVRATSHPPG